jgi:capsular polysaccharide export protein
MGFRGDVSQAPMDGTAVTFSRKLAALPGLAAMIGVERVVWSRGGPRAVAADVVLGWGLRPRALEARAWAERYGKPFLTLEDGFLRSIRLGVEGASPLSVVVDDLGIYYDATRPSRLEVMLNHPAGTGDSLADPALRRRSRDCIDRIVEAHLSKYNYSSTRPVEDFVGPRRGPRVLVVDQVAGDLSVTQGLVAPNGFGQMLAAAVDENPGAEIIVKTHPDVAAGRRQSAMGPAASFPRVRLLSGNVNPMALVRSVDRVYVATSQLGFEALMAGTPVTCFGMPFYAGWGLTDDRVDCPRRARGRSLEQVFAAAYLLYAGYRDADTGKSRGVEDVIEHLALQRRWFAENAGQVYCLGFRPWKRRFVRDFLRSPDSEVRFCRSLGVARRGGLGNKADDRILVWGVTEPVEVREFAAERRIPLWRMEDGFLRSAGLGSDLTRPASLVVDHSGIYFDPAQPSDLEKILEAGDFPPALIERARVLTQQVVSQRVTKYNFLWHAAEIRPRKGQRVVLVPGQVDDDASIRTGAPVVRTSLDLLRTVRDQVPDGYIVFKPHPDALGGNRGRAPNLDAFRAVADHVETRADLHSCLEIADEVHTLTSLVGFEALLHGKPVITYGLPFYAGWGLTKDQLVLPEGRRTRRLSVEELVAGTLILYPRYLHPHTSAFTTPEYIVRRLAEEARPVAPHGRGWVARQAHRAWNLVREATRG